MRALKVLGVAVLAACVAGGCALYRNDRQYIWDLEYYKVRQLYDRTGSVDVALQVLRDRKWTRAQIREVEYRLRQDYSLDEQGNPRGIDRPQPIIPSTQVGGLGLGPGARDRPRGSTRGY